MSVDPILAELAEPFERMPPAEAKTLLAELYGVAAVGLERLDTERDDSFRVTTADGDLVLKVAHPADDPELIDLQVAAPAYAAAADPTLPLQLAVRPPTQWRGRAVRVLAWLPGGLLHEVTPDAGQLFALGAALGRLSSALRGFEHPAAARELAWDLQRLPSLRPIAHDALTLGVIARFEQEVAPVLSGLPQQVIHNDFHPGNVLVSSADPRYVVGILDFGDTVHTARVCDLGVALAYLIPSDGPAMAAVQPFIDGYESIVPLLDAERALIPDLVAARLVARIVLNTVLAETRDDLQHSAEANVRLLRNLLTEG